MTWDNVAFLVAGLFVSAVVRALQERRRRRTRRVVGTVLELRELHARRRR